MIFAQRPDATACAEYDLWNDTMRRYVRRGSRASLLWTIPRKTPASVCVRHFRHRPAEKFTPPLPVGLRPEHEAAVVRRSPSGLGAAENNLAEQLESIAAQLVSEYWVEHKRDILDIVDGSFLEGYDEFNIGVQFRNAATVSITRCCPGVDWSRKATSTMRTFKHLRFQHPGGGGRPGNGGQPEQPAGAAADRHYHPKL